MEIYIPVKVISDKVTFNLLAIWNFYFACKQGRFKGVRGDGALEWIATKRYTSQLLDPCLFAGDWNFGPTFSQRAFVRLCNELTHAGFSSLYHKFYNLEHTESHHSTFITPTKKYHHLDHFFGTKEFLDGMTNYEIPSVDDAILSDHSPIILDIDLTSFTN
jgi:exonuclease III